MDYIAPEKMKGIIDRRLFFGLIGENNYQRFPMILVVVFMFPLITSKRNFTIIVIGTHVSSPTVVNIP